MIARPWVRVSPPSSWSSVFCQEQGGGTRRSIGEHSRVLYSGTFAHAPLCVWYLVQIYSKSTVPLWNWALALVYLGCFIGIVMRLIGYGFLAAKDSPYPFAPEEMERFDRRGHLARLGKNG